MKKQLLFLLLSISLYSAIALPAQADQYYDAGVKYYRKKNFKMALRYFAQASHDAPWDSGAMYYMALTYHQLKDFQTAKAQYALIVERFPGTQASVNASNALKAMDPMYFAPPKPTPGKKAPAAPAKSSTPAAAVKSSASNGDVLPEQTKVYFTKQGNVVLIDAAINNRNLKMIFDTGASTTHLGKNHLLALGIKPPTGEATGMTGGVGSSEGIPEWEMKVDIRVGGITKHNFPITLQENMTNEPLLGQTFFSDFAYTFNYNTNTIVLQKKHDSSGGVTGSYCVPFKKEGAHLIVDVLVNGRSCPMIFDTGADSCSFSTKQIKDLHIAIPDDATEGLSSGVGGSTKTYRFTVPRMKLGPIDKTNVEIGVIEDTMMGHPLLGQSFYNNWEYTIDNAAGVIRFVRR